MLLISSFFLFFIVNVSVVNSLKNMSAMESHELVPDVIDVAPANEILVTMIFSYKYRAWYG